MQWLKQSTAATVTIGPILDSAGAEYTGAVIGDISIRKHDGTSSAALASAATLTHDANGMYKLVMTTGNTDTLGRLDLHCNKSTYQMPQKSYDVVPAMVYDSIVLGTDVLQSDVTQLLGTAWLTPAVAGTPDVNAKQIAGQAAPATNLNTIFNTDYATVYDATNKAFLSKLGNFAMGGSSLVVTWASSQDFSSTQKTSITTAVPTATAIAAATEAAILDEGDATPLLAAIAAKVETFLINDGDATATLAAIATAVWANASRTLSSFTFPVGLADDAITAAKFDESTAFPLKSADTGATAVARPGDAMALTSGERTTLASSIWNALTSGMSTVGSIGKRLVDYVTGDTFTRLGAPADTSIANDIANISAGSAPTAAEVADAVCDELLAGHAIAGSVGAAISAAGSAGDPWITPLPGSYAVGTAGYIIGTSIAAMMLVVNTILSIVRDITGVGQSSGSASSSADAANLLKIPLTPTITGRTTAKSGVNLFARVVGNNGQLLTRSSLASITYNVYNLTDESQVGTGTLTIASVIFDALQQSDASWTKDSADNPGVDGRWGYNFRTTLPASLFVLGDVRYQVDVVFVPASGEQFVQTFQFQPRNVYVA